MTDHHCVLHAAIQVRITRHVVTTTVHWLRAANPAGRAGDWLRSSCPTPIDVVAAVRFGPPDSVRCWRTGIDAAGGSSSSDLRRHPGAIIDEINCVDDAARSPLVIGHEPAMSQLALASAAPTSNARPPPSGSATKYPTSAMAVPRVSRILERAGTRRRGADDVLHAPAEPPRHRGSELARRARQFHFSYMAWPHASMPGACVIDPLAGRRRWRRWPLPQASDRRNRTGHRRCCVAPDLVKLRRRVATSLPLSRLACSNQNR